MRVALAVRVASVCVLCVCILACVGVCWAQGVNTLVVKEYDAEREAEVLPGQFLKYQEHGRIWKLKHGDFGSVHTMNTEPQAYYQRNTLYLSIPWNGTDVFWVGVGLPIAIRVHESLLYMITFDRETDINAVRFRFYKQTHSTFREIEDKMYPPAIATQNLRLKTENGFRDGKAVNEVESVLQLDPDDVTFRESLTAKVWWQLATGEEYYQAPSLIDSDFLRTFLAKHGVVRLKKIIFAEAIGLN